MTHDEANELLAALALDALDDEIRAAVEAHVDACERCQGELDGLHEVASALGTAYEAPPEGLWDRISERLYEREGAAPALALGDLTAPVEGAPAPLVAARTRRVRAILVGVALAAAAAIVALGWSLAAADHQVANLQEALGHSSESAVLAALDTPGHKVVSLDDAARQPVAQFVILPDGRGYLVSDDMPRLAKDETYQLWGIVNEEPVSVGVMGSSPRSVAFTLASSPAPSALAVTVEPAGGAQTPAKTIVASGAV